MTRRQYNQKNGKIWDEDPDHPGHNLFDLLPSGKCFRSIMLWTTRTKNSSYPRALWEMITAKNKYHPWLLVFMLSVKLSLYVIYAFGGWDFKNTESFWDFLIIIIIVKLCYYCTLFYNFCFVLFVFCKKKPSHLEIQLLKWMLHKQHHDSEL